MYVQRPAKYSFIIGINAPSSVRCKKYRTKFDGSYSGASGIEQHLNSEEPEIFPVLVRFFQHYEGPKVKIIHRQDRSFNYLVLV